MTRQHYTQFNVGDRVRASDGTKRPPDRFNRKLADWKTRNFVGTVADIEEARDYQPNGGLVLKKDDYPNGLHGCISFQFHHPLGGTIQFEKIPAGWEKAETEAA